MLSYQGLMADDVNTSIRIEDYYKGNTTDGNQKLNSTLVLTSSLLSGLFCRVVRVGTGSHHWY